MGACDSVRWSVIPPKLATCSPERRADSPPHSGKALKLASVFHAERTKPKPESASAYLSDSNWLIE